MGSPRGPPSAQLVRFVPRGEASRACRSVPFLGGHVQGFAGKRGSRCRSPPVPCRNALLARSGRLPLLWVNDHLDFMVAFIPRLFSVSFSPHCPCTHLSPCSCHPFPSLVPRHTSWHRRLLGSGLSAASPGLRAGCPRSGCGVTMGGDPPAVPCPARCLPPLSLTAVPFFLLQLD